MLLTVVHRRLPTRGMMVGVSDLVLCTLDQGAKLNMEFTVETGKGYVAGRAEPAGGCADRPHPGRCAFSPVRKVTYKVENSRVGQVTDYDKLSMQIETNGAVTPEDSVALAARILQDQLQLFINFEEPTAAGEEDKARPSRRSTRTCCARSTSSSCRSARPTA